MLRKLQTIKSAAVMVTLEMSTRAPLFQGTFMSTEERVIVVAKAAQGFALY
jgi:hypothetical protein